MVGLSLRRTVQGVSAVAIIASAAFSVTTHAALSAETAQSYISRFKSGCQEGKPSDGNSTCYKLATDLKNGAGCKTLYQGAGGKITDLFPENINDCQQKVTALVTKEAREKDQNSAAEKACKDSKSPSSCEKGFLGGAQNKSKSSACSGLTGTNASACGNGYTKGKDAAQNNGGSGSSGGGGPSLTAPSGTLASPIDLNALPDTTANDSKLDTLANIAFGIAGALAMLFVVVGGVRYIMSQGDSQKVAQAKNTILYAVAGLVVTISAFAIVRFVLLRIVG